jgi:hypothetical protein
MVTPHDMSRMRDVRHRHLELALAATVPMCIEAPFVVSTLTTTTTTTTRTTTGGG